MPNDERKKRPRLKEEPKTTIYRKRKHFSTHLIAHQINIRMKLRRMNIHLRKSRNLIYGIHSTKWRFVTISATCASPSIIFVSRACVCCVCVRRTTKTEKAENKRHFSYGEAVSLISITNGTLNERAKEPRRKMKRDRETRKFSVCNWNLFWCQTRSFCLRFFRCFTFRCCCRRRCTGSVRLYPISTVRIARLLMLAHD